METLYKLTGTWEIKAVSLNTSFQILHCAKETVWICIGADLLNQCMMHFRISSAKIYVWVNSVTITKWRQCSSKQLAQFCAESRGKSNESYGG